MNWWLVSIASHLLGHKLRISFQHCHQPRCRRRRICHSEKFQKEQSEIGSCPDRRLRSLWQGQLCPIFGMASFGSHRRWSLFRLEAAQMHGTCGRCSSCHSAEEFLLLLELQVWSRRDPFATWIHRWSRLCQILNKTIYVDFIKPHVVFLTVFLCVCCGTLKFPQTFGS